MKPSIYTTDHVNEYRSLREARFNFVDLCFKRDYPIALVRERGLNFEVTFSHNETIKLEHFGSMKEVSKFLINQFNRE